MFRTKGILEVCNRSGLFRLASPLVWDDGKYIVVVPTGFITDLASVPRIFHSLVPVNGRHRLPAVLHDYLYVVQETTRSRADKLFRAAMVERGVPAVERTILYSAVRLGGSMPWERNALDLVLDRERFLKRYGLITG